MFYIEESFPIPTHSVRQFRDNYINLYRLKKTGAFFAIPVVGEAILGGAYDRHLASLRDFALQAGVAFQIENGVLDYVGGKGRPQVAIS